MAKYFYSPSARGFYREGLSSQIPEDALPVTAKRHAQLLAAQAEGAAIVPCAKSGRPLLDRPPSDAASERTRLTLQVKAEAGRRIRAVAPLWRQINDTQAITLGEVDEQVMGRIARVAAIRAASGRIEEQIESAAVAALKEFPLATHPYWPETD